MTVNPAQQDSGINFVLDNVSIPANHYFLDKTQFCTSLRNKDKTVRTVEHFLSAVVALGLDNLEVHLDASELPCLDGSSYEFYWGLLGAGVVRQTASKVFCCVTKKVEVTLGNAQASLSPNPSPKVSVRVDYHEPIISNGGLSSSFDLFHEDYSSEVARARTYGFEKDFEFFKKNQLALGAQLENCLVLSDSQVLSPGGMRYFNEVVRHKILDVIGDLSLLGKLFVGHYQGFRPGHSLNLLLVKAIIEQEAYEFLSYAELTSRLKSSCAHG